MLWHEEEVLGIVEKLFEKARTEQGRKDLRYALARNVNRVSRPLGFTILADHFYQPLPGLKELSLYDNRPRPLENLRFDAKAQEAYVKGVLQAFKDELNNPEVIGSFGYDENYSQLKSGDAEFLYAMIRGQEPEQVIEIGSGGSTLIIAAALDQNYRTTGKKSRLISIEPFPIPAVRELRSSQGFTYELHAQPVQLIDPALFSTLAARDLLFVDSSHVFKQGSDVEYEFLKIYPILKPGVVVHIHDIFFPNDYPLSWNLKECRYWNEQYFLEVFLLGNERVKLLASLSFVNSTNQGVFSDAIHCFHESRLPGSFWMQITPSLSRDRVR